MPEPRLVKTGNNEFIETNVTLLQMGLSQCRSAAESAAMQHRDNEELCALTAEIVRLALETLYGLENEQESTQGELDACRLTEAGGETHE